MYGRMLERLKLLVFCLIGIRRFFCTFLFNELADFAYSRFEDVGSSGLPKLAWFIANCCMKRIGGKGSIARPSGVVASFEELLCCSLTARSCYGPCHLNC